MITFDRDIVFVDTETLGLAPDAPIWEFAAIRIAGMGADVAAGKVLDQVEFLVEHDTSYGTGHLPESFAKDYRARYWAEFAWPAMHAAREIHKITDGAIVAGSNPSFDIERLELLLQAHGIDPAWHYHPLDIPSMAAGWYVGNGGGELFWRSTELSTAVGVDPDDYERHTALGDVKWCLAQWKAMNGQDS